MFTINSVVAMTTFSCNLIGWRSDFYSFSRGRARNVCLDRHDMSSIRVLCIFFIKKKKYDKNPFEQIRKFGMCRHLMCIQWERKPVSLSIRRVIFFFFFQFH